MGEWEQSQPVNTARAGRCVWYGCEEPGFIRATWRVQTPVTLHPSHVFCPKHALASKTAFAEAERRTAAWLAAGMPKPSGWEPDKRSKVRRRASRLVEIMREKKMRERADLLERDGARRELMQSWQKKQV
jgi:hypothetical protein